MGLHQEGRNTLESENVLVEGLSQLASIKGEYVQEKIDAEPYLPHMWPSPRNHGACIPPFPWDHTH